MTTSGASIASKMQDVSAGGEKCTSFKDCLALLKDEKDIDYDGVSGPVEFNDKGDPSEARSASTSTAPTTTTPSSRRKAGKI